MGGYEGRRRGSSDSDDPSIIRLDRKRGETEIDVRQCVVKRLIGKLIVSKTWQNFNSVSQTEETDRERKGREEPRG